MTETKPWYLSKTVWGALVAIGASLSGAAGLHLDGGAQAVLVDTILQVGSAAGALVALIGRFAANQKIG